MNRDSSQAEFIELLAEHHGQLFGYLFALVHNLADAEDLFQQTSLTLWDKFDQFERGTDFGKWARGTAHFVALNFLRVQKRHRARFSVEFVEELAGSKHSEFDGDDVRRDALDACMERLSESDREVIHIYYAERATAKTAAKQLGRSADGLYKSLRRIRHALYECITRRLSKAEQNDVA